MRKFCTPWGVAHSVKALDWESKVLEVHTASHGGIGVHPDIELPQYAIDCADVAQDGMRWFEEDVCWAAAAIALPKFFTTEQLQCAEHTLRHSLPTAYMAAFGVVLAVEASRHLEQEAFDEATRNNFTLSAGFDSSFWNVPPGMVYACGWRRRDEATKGFLVPEAEYLGADRSRLVLDGFPEWEPDRSMPYLKRAAVAARCQTVAR